MTKEQKIRELIEKIVKNYKPPGDDFNVYDYSGGNYDDAYSLGVDHGEGDLATDILEILNENK